LEILGEFYGIKMTNMLNHIYEKAAEIRHSIAYIWS